MVGQLRAPSSSSKQLMRTHARGQGRKSTRRLQWGLPFRLSDPRWSWHATRRWIRAAKVRAITLKWSSGHDESPHGVLTTADAHAALLPSALLSYFSSCTWVLRGVVKGSRSLHLAGSTAGLASSMFTGHYTRNYCVNVYGLAAMTRSSTRPRIATVVRSPRLLSSHQCSACGILAGTRAPEIS